MGFELDILADYILSEVKKAERIFANETTFPTIVPRSDQRRQHGYGPLQGLTEPSG